MGREKVLLRTVPDYNPSSIKLLPIKESKKEKIRPIKRCPPKHKDLVIDASPCLFFCWMRRLFKGRFK